MLKKRIIPCLDVKDGRTVKGIHFVDLRDAGDPISLSRAYASQGADELVLLDITATVEGRGTFLKVVEEVAEQVDIPFTVGGGIRSVEDAESFLKAGADKVSVNSAAVKNPDLISRLADRFGTQCVVLAVDAGWVGPEWYVFTHGGRQATTMKAMEWIERAPGLGAGEILLTSMANDGTKSGFACGLVKEAGKLSGLPIIASGGAGTLEHFAEVFVEGEADAALAASIFHFGEVQIPTLKAYLKQCNIPIR